MLLPMMRLAFLSASTVLTSFVSYVAEDFNLKRIAAHACMHACIPVSPPIHPAGLWLVQEPQPSSQGQHWCTAEPVEPGFLGSSSPVQMYS